MKGVYISGPMTNRPDYNRPLFDRYERMLKAMGVRRVFNPAAQDRPADWMWADHMAADLKELTSGVYDVLLSLPDSDCSRGAQLERRVAEAIGIEVWEVK